MQEQLAAEEQQISAQRQEAELSALLARDAAAARSKALAAWADKIRATIRSNIVLPPGIKGNPEAVFQIVLLPTAEVLRVDVEKSSNNSCARRCDRSRHTEVLAAAQAGRSAESSTAASS